MILLEKMVWAAAYVHAWNDAWGSLIRRQRQPGQEDLGDDWPRKQAVKSADAVVLDMRKHEEDEFRFHDSEDLELERKAECR